MTYCNATHTNTNGLKAIGKKPLDSLASALMKYNHFPIIQTNIFKALHQKARGVASAKVVTMDFNPLTSNIFAIN